MPAAHVAVHLHVVGSCIELANATTSVWGTANIGPGKPFTDTQAKWIWSHAGADLGTSSGVRTTISTTVTAAAPGTQTLLHLIVENFADVYLNGAFVTRLTGGWRNQQEYTNRPLQLTLAAGTNTLSVAAYGASYGGRAGLLASLTSSDSTTVLARTSSDWTCSVDVVGSRNSIEVAPALSSIWGTANIGPGKPFNDTQAKWIWAHSGSTVSSSYFLRPIFTTMFVVPQDTSALLSLIVDDRADIVFNGQMVTALEWGYLAGQYTNRPVRLNLKRGINTLSVIVTNYNNPGSPAGLLASLSSSDGRSVYSRTSSSAWVYSALVSSNPGCIELAWSGKPFPDTQAKWIWSDAGRSSGMRTAMTTILYAQQAGTRVLLNAISLSTANVYLNGILMGSLPGGGNPTSLLFNRTLAVGTNTISVAAYYGVPTPGQAGFVASLTSSDGTTLLARTSTDWTCSVNVPSI
ncbi:hypothetical protein VOLCADRAFT_96245 [Volvox carteri f. nagariensis]|uniref:Uncharacterized protein n=1 Tax=Volvox carteri f. nagariensis TaxID=3068 RepID=D8U9L4_VOLCA|nr:uncharacterized protein VOLCADRAFT_96245 [Volvox carteri f. nagariensis]EFJ43601.1 hypothetical protein VOLCADRAFT_96245 [Volvox carteri f. nagariensis]|eukprot:XP_002955301.1 hypothetical protein VOLCADRAFT_96245 [Volvox carteri f. nagariensis]